MNGPELARPPIEPIQIAQAGENIFVVRVEGRGSFQNCGGLKQFVDRQWETDPDTEFVIDLERCVTMDSTFMGVIAGIGLRQRQAHRGRMVLVNLNTHTAKLLKTLGLTHFLDVRAEPAPQPPAGEFRALAEEPPMSRLERIRMMIEAHQRLVDVDKGNEVKFQGVLNYLAESLDKAERKSQGGSEALDVD